MKPLRSVAAFLALLGSSAVDAQEPTLDINVRTTVELPAGQSLGAHPTFAMLPAVEIFSAEKLAYPVPQSTLLAFHKLLQEKLEAQGYVGVPDKTRPEVLITVQYGRGYLPNPYTIGTSTSMGGPGSVSAYGGRGEGPKGMTGDSGPSITASGVGDYLRHYDTHYEGRMQAAEHEKLFFTVAAWKFASMQKGAKPVRYWTTTMLVDDPDHRDLNGIYKQMLAAGAEFFNRRLNREEVEVSTTIREGRVEVGVPRVVEEPKTKK